MKKDKIENNIDTLIRVIFFMLFFVFIITISNKLVKHNEIQNKHEYVLNHNISDSKAIITNHTFVSSSIEFLKVTINNNLSKFSNPNHKLFLENNKISQTITISLKKREEIKSIAFLFFYRQNTYKSSDDLPILS